MKNIINKKSCEGCGAKCCKYVSIELDIPEELDDFENIRWYVAHKNISVYVEEDGFWYVEFRTPCEYLDGEKCSIHEKFTTGKIKRPEICKEFNVEQCPQFNDYEELYTFNTMKDVDDYIENVFKKGKHEVVERE